MPISISQLQHFADANLTGVVELVGKAFPLTARTNVVEVTGNVINVPVITEDVPGEFRESYTGKENSGYASTSVPVSLQYCDASYSIDDKVIKTDPQGIEASCARAVASSIRGAMRAMETAAFRGVGINGSILKGLDQTIPAENVVDAGGAGDGGTLTDVYILNDEAVNLFVAGGDLFEVGEVQRSPITDDNGKIYYAYGQLVAWYSALCAVNYFGTAKITNISTTKKHRITDDLIFEAMSRLDPSYPPSAIYMSNSSARALQISRNITLHAGRGTVVAAPAPTVVDAGGTPVFISSAIPNARAAAPQPEPDPEP